MGVRTVLQADKPLNNNNSSWPWLRTYQCQRPICNSVNLTTTPAGGCYSTHPESDHFPSFPCHHLGPASILSHLCTAQPLAWSLCSSPFPPPIAIPHHNCQGNPGKPEVRLGHSFTFSNPLSLTPEHGFPCYPEQKPRSVQWPTEPSGICSRFPL